MTLGKYQYLEKHIGPHNHVVKVWQENSFLPVSNTDIKTAETKAGISFPKSLKEFWLSIGCGHLTVGKEMIEGYECYYSNRILSPEAIADIMLLKEESGYVLPTVFDNEFFEEGDIPFFEICDMQFFLVMKPNSDKPDAIYNINKPGVVIEEHFERFIWRLYHESPDYYLHVDPKLAK